MRNMILVRVTLKQSKTHSGRGLIIAHVVSEVDADLDVEVRESDAVSDVYSYSLCLHRYW